MRRATAQDRERVLAWCVQPRYPDSAVTRVSAQDRLAWFRAGYEQGWQRLCDDSKLSLWVDDDTQDYLVARHGERESLTGQRQTVIWDWGRQPATFLPAVKERAALGGDEYVVVQHFEGVDNPWPELAFQPELRRVLSATSQGTQSQGHYTVRQAQSKDLFFIANLHTQGSQFYLPAHRQVNAEEMMARTMNAYMAMDLDSTKSILGFVICQGIKPFGYILYKIPFKLEVSRASAAYLYDLNLKPEYWGRSAGGQLGVHSLWELKNRGIDFVVGDISSTNEQSYLAATRAGHFKWESTRWGLAL